TAKVGREETESELAFGIARIRKRPVRPPERGGVSPFKLGMRICQLGERRAGLVVQSLQQITVSRDQTGLQFERPPVRGDRFVRSSLVLEGVGEIGMSLAPVGTELDRPAVGCFGLG